MGREKSTGAFDYRPASSEDELRKRTNRGGGLDTWNPTEDEGTGIVEAAEEKVLEFRKLDFKQLGALDLEQLRDYQTAAQTVQERTGNEGLGKKNIEKILEQIDGEIAQLETQEDV